jgi:5-(carboxyamino)imidazole ribonucleotide synthase
MAKPTSRPGTFIATAYCAVPRCPRAPHFRNGGNRRAEAAFAILEALDYVGVIGVEFFVLATTAESWSTNSRRESTIPGHWTEAACVISQFEQHIRAICGLPLGDDDAPFRLRDGKPDRRRCRPCGGPAWAEPGLVLHLYGKTETRPGRKMGHFTRLAR